MASPNETAKLIFSAPDYLGNIAADHHMSCADLLAINPNLKDFLEAKQKKNKKPIDKQVIPPGTEMVVLRTSDPA